MKEKSLVIDSSASAAKVAPKIIKPELGGVYLDILMEVHKPSGELVSQHQELGRSFLANFIKMLYSSAMINEAPTADGVALTLFDTDGVERAGLDSALQNILSSSEFMDCNGLGTNDEQGILVGTDDGTILPKDINNYALGAKCSEGTGTSQLNYGTHSIVTPVDDDSTYSYAGITRTASNGSGASIGVNEVGLVCYGRWDHNVTSRYFMLIRDILGTPVTVPNGDTLTVSYRCKCFC